MDLSMAHSSDPPSSAALEGLEADDAGQDVRLPGPNPWVLQYRILKAIVLRDMTAKYSQSRAGYIVGIVLPLATFGFLYLTFNLRGRVAPPDFPMPVFLVTGYPIWMAFMQTYTAIAGTASRSDPLLAFPQITQLDLIFAAFIL